MEDRGTGERIRNWGIRTPVSVLLNLLCHRDGIYNCSHWSQVMPAPKMGQVPVDTCCV